MGGIEFGKCEICGKETSLERTYFYFPIHCECCGCKDEYGQKLHFEMVCHCKDCPAPIPKGIKPLCKAFDGKVYKEYIVNMRPIAIRGRYISNDPAFDEYDGNIYGIK